MTLSFTTAESGYGVQSMDDLVRRLWSAPTDVLGDPAPPLGPHPREHSPGVVAHAIVRQSRWVVLCPWCPSAEYAHFADRRFFCVECGNAAVSGKWVAVEWPKNPEEIELHLSVRADPTTRGWEWGERIGDLAVENAENGASGLELP